MQSTDTPDTTLHAVGTSAFVGLVVAGLWWACGRCHRSLLLEARLCADTESVYRFLSDPKNLKLIHPTTSVHFFLLFPLVCAFKKRGDTEYIVEENKRFKDLVGCKILHRYLLSH